MSAEDRGPAGEGISEEPAIDLRRQSKILQAVLANVTDGVIVADAQGTLLIVNQAAERIMGTYPGGVPLDQWPKLFGLFLPDKATPFPPERTPLLRALLGETLEDLELFVRNPNVPEGIFVTCSSGPIKDGEAVIGAVVFLREITRRKRAEEELKRRAEDLERSNAELNQFATMASHELQEPLRKIRAFGDLIKTLDPQPCGEEGEYIEKMQGAAKRMQRLVDDILNLSRVTTNAKALERVDLGELLGEVAADFKARLAAAGGELEVASLPSLRADRFQLRQVFENLLSNAFKFRKKEEPLRVRVSCRQGCQGFVEIAVEDNGIGFEQEYADRIFKPFQRLRRRDEYEGSGMGLAICRRILMRHGGDLGARSRPGEGSVFIVTLPMSDRTIHPREPEAS